MHETIYRSCLLYDSWDETPRLSHEWCLCLFVCVHGTEKTIKTRVKKSFFAGPAFFFLFLSFSLLILYIPSLCQCSWPFVDPDSLYISRKHQKSKSVGLTIFFQLKNCRNKKYAFTESFRSFFFFFENWSLHSLALESLSLFPWERIMYF